jgi:Uma2 family endonuclease
MREVPRGQERVSPRPALAHARCAGHLHMLLAWTFDRRRGSGGGSGWWLVIEPELRLASGGPIVPDLAGWRRERLPVTRWDSAATVLPDWACEILPPGTEAGDRYQKMEIYRDAGVVHLWLVDLSLRRLEVFVLQGGAYMLAGAHVGDCVVKAAPFGALDLDLSEIWAPA